MSHEYLDDQKLLQTVHQAIAAHLADQITPLAAQLKPSDWATLILRLEPFEVAVLLQWLPDSEIPEILAELDPEEAATILRSVSRPIAADYLEEMQPDDATDIIEELPVAEAEQILVAMEPADAAEIRDLLSYPPETAGGRMTPACVSMEPTLRADQAIAALRQVAAEAETVNYVYVVDADERLLGVLSLRDLVLAQPATEIVGIMVRDVVKVEASTDQEVAARLLVANNLLALPVVDDLDRLLGIVTVDDVVDVLQEEFEEDYHRLAGSDADAMSRRSPVQIARLRLPWLLGTMGIELVAGVVISRFNGVLQQVILLASFMPIISAVSGNVGLQAAAIVVRGLDTGHVAMSEWGRQLRRELSTTLLMALACGLILGLIGAVWSQHLPFGVVIGVALTAAMLTAGLMGSLIPMASKRLGFDPATTAGPFETAFQDVVGFAVFLWLASLLVTWLS